MTADVIKVVIVTYNCANEIVECIGALLGASEKYAFEITVVDNGSQDETLQKIVNLNHPVHVMANTNMGYAHGCNLAIREALDSQKEYKAILILNPDVTLHAGAIDSMADALFASREVGGVSPHVVEKSGSEHHRLKTLFGTSMHENPVIGRNVVVSDRLHGCCMLLRTEVFQKTGWFDEQFFLYWEELDFGLRAIADGFKLLLCYDVVVYHRCNTRERQHRIYYMWRNQFQYAKKNYAPFLRLIFLIRRMSTSIKELVGFVVMRRFDLVGAAMAGLLAGLRGETGKSQNRYAMPSNPNMAVYKNES